ncbi:MAG: hypothetical protein HY717_15375 [Planctomycetes bacterium]|nr:hypothetical protein [Planctomycetota bacterium]
MNPAEKLSPVVEPASEPAGTDPGATKNYTPKNGFLELGSTSIKFYLVALSGERAGEVEKELKIPWDLGYEVFQNRRISPTTITSCLKALRDLSSRFPEIPFEGVTAIGTSALREAQNVDIFMRLLKEDLGLKVGIIEGGIEAFLLELGFKGSVREFPTGLFDLGGGSLELVEYLSPHSTRKTSVPIGAIRLHCLLRRRRNIFDYIQGGREIVLDSMQAYIGGLPYTFRELIGTGGTVRAIVHSLKKDCFQISDLHGLIQRELRGEPQGELLPYRRRVFLPGLLVVECLFTALKVKEIAYRSASVKGGLISLTRLIPLAGA